MTENFRIDEADEEKVTPANTFGLTTKAEALPLRPTALHLKESATRRASSSSSPSIIVEGAQIVMMIRRGIFSLTLRFS